MSDRRAFAPGHLIELAAGLRQLPRRDREPGDEGNILLFAEVDHILVVAVTKVVLVLDADDRYDSTSLLDLPRLDLGKPHVEDFAFLLQLLDLTERLFDRDLRVDAMKLPEIDALQLQRAQAEFDLLPKVLGPANRKPLSGSLPGESALGRDDHSLRVGRKRLSDQLLADLRAVGVRGVDEVDAKFHRAAK